MANCPHCSKVIDVPPNQLGNCPHCKEPIKVRNYLLLTPAQAEKVDVDKTAQRAAERLARVSQITIDNVNQARDSGVVAGFKLLLSGDECRVCRKNKKQMFPIATCTPEMLPPYEDCEYDDGCSGTFVSILHSRYSSVGRREEGQEKRRKHSRERRLPKRIFYSPLSHSPLWPLLWWWQRPDGPLRRMLKGLPSLSQ